MANTKISALTAVTDLSASSIIPIVLDPAGSPLNRVVPVSVLDARYTRTFNVKLYGAVGDGTADDTSAIQDAIDAAHDAGGGEVTLPVGTFKITSELTLYSSITIRGAGMEVSVIKQATINENGLVGSALSSVKLYDFMLQGNATGSTAGTGTGIGIFLDYGGAGNNPYHHVSDVMVRNWGAEGIKIQTAIVSNFTNVISAYNGTHGFNWYEGATSCVFNNCWARQNGSAGYRFFNSVYQSLNGCAADNNGTNYMVLDAQSISFDGCGSEGALENGGLFDGFGWYIDNSTIISLDSCWITDNRNIGVWVTNGANAITLDVADNTPNGTAVNFIKTDTGTGVTIENDHHTTDNSLAAGSYMIINDGANGLHAGDLFALNQDASTVPVFNVNKALVSSNVTPTELSYLEGVTSNIQDQLDSGGGGAGYPWEGAWTTATGYEVNDCVEHDGSGYVCIEAHTSGTFATDLSANKWDLLVAKGDDGTMALNISLSNSTFSGATSELTAGENLVLGDVCRVNSSSKLVKADASAIATAGALFIALETIASDATGDFGALGYLRNDSGYALTPQGLIYLSTTAGAITQTRPTGTDEVVQIVGIAFTADIIYWKPELTMIELV